jgi:hypothetical protein
VLAIASAIGGDAWNRKGRTGVKVELLVEDDRRIALAARWALLAPGSLAA